MDKEVYSALSQMILSASGWRKIFTEDQDEESSNPSITQVDGWLAYVAGIAFTEYLTSLALPSQKIILGRDSRPTGATLIAHIALALEKQGFSYDYLGITTITEFLAYTRSAGKEYDGFFYITASHNPVGYNGFKFGLSSGDVLGGKASASVIDIYKRLLATTYANPEELKPRTILANSSLKLQATHEYRQFLQRTMLSLHKNHMEQIAQSIAEQGGFGILIDFNGSARITSVDQSLLAELGVVTQVLGAQLGQFTHAIVPEGDSLLHCMQELEKLHASDPRYQLGIVVDCDGDRGNLIYIDQKGKAIALDAQTTFSLSVISSLIYEQMRGGSKLGVVVNDATSLRIADITHALRAECHWAETGEANVLAKAKHLRDQGLNIPIAGEGSNGGTIIYPSTVRDPLTTVLALLNVLFLSHNMGSALVLLQQKLKVSPAAWGVADLIDHLPQYATTSVVASDSLIQIKKTPFSLKQRYLELLQQAWPQWQTDYTRVSLHSFAVIHYEGIEQHAHLKEPALGGMRVHLCDRDSNVIVALWLRGSKTEPVLRLMVDCKAPYDQDVMYWHALHRELILQADHFDE
ncbi:hypothetical protein PVA45_00910 [Entomospira entomophila]|uniref:Phosphoglucomutase n=1 Tax=Entomospira entomophila TaxID=2719988 RepID=A0A968KVQ3_9SPIO|nr:hypothetical protein [Entomospira entomophilus]NIZ40080.1 hypothetical protein [Entomospira entomophilus]WDI35641.1 hypothetical protein PVA45_00910 [Entomospira entomophilus]